MRDRHTSDFIEPENQKGFVVGLADAVHLVCEDGVAFVPPSEILRITVIVIEGGEMAENYFGRRHALDGPVSVGPFDLPREKTLSQISHAQEVFGKLTIDADEPRQRSNKAESSQRIDRNRGRCDSSTQQYVEFALQE